VLLVASAWLAGATARAEGEPEILLDVSIARGELRIVEHGRLAAAFRVATGTPGQPTPRGSFPIERVIGNPSYTPGPLAELAGAVAMPPSTRSPLGVAKIPFHGSFQVHGGAYRYAVGMPVTLGCIQLTDDDMSELIGWLSALGALEQGVASPEGEMHHRLRRRVSVRIQ
jgi:lipoprotein-anchoring transpeptidase ErfK/SrfK